jgi:hypothetical protein
MRVHLAVQRAARSRRLELPADALGLAMVYQIARDIAIEPTTWAFFVFRQENDGAWTPFMRDPSKAISFPGPLSPASLLMYRSPDGQPASDGSTPVGKPGAMEGALKQWLSSRGYTLRESGGAMWVSW